MSEQPELPGLALPSVRQAGPVARVLLDTPLPHLSQPFDYLVPEGMTVQPGVRVRVRFAGVLTPGFVTELRDHSDHPGTLRPLAKLVSDVPVLTPEVLQLASDVAAAYAGSVSDVLRLAIPPRHATVEKNFVVEAGAFPTPGCDDGWDDYVGGPALLRRLASGEPVRAVWTALPGVRDGRPRWLDDLRAPVAATLRAGKRVLVLVPTAREAEQTATALCDLGSVVTFTGEMDQAPRYRAFLRILGGMADITVGTRSAAFAPVPELGLVVVWDPDDESLAERRAPYPSTLGVAVQRRGCALLVGSVSRSAAAQQLVEDGWAVAIGSSREVVRSAAPRVHAPLPEDVHGDARRIPSAAFALLREHLDGPVLIHVPRAGYLRSVRCAECGGTVRCRHCAGPMDLNPQGRPVCGWCSRTQAVSCESCGSSRLKAYSVGSERTTDEIARAFPGVPVTLSNARVGVTASVGDEPRIVIATPGAEPVPEQGYRAALILDAAVATSRPELGASAQALDRWLWALSLVRPAADGGVAMILGEPEGSLAQACIRWDPAAWAAAHLREREELHFPPAWRVARIEGAASALRDVARDLVGRVECEMLGPTGEVLLARAPRTRGRELTRALREVQAERSVRKEEVIRVHVDPPDL